MFDRDTPFTWGDLVFLTGLYAWFQRLFVCSFFTWGDFVLNYSMHGFRCCCFF